MKWFGRAFAPCHEPSEKVDTPVNEKCQQCEQLIGPEDDGFVFPILMEVVDAERGVWTEMPWHYVCFMRNIFGPEWDSARYYARLEHDKEHHNDEL